MPRFFRSLFGQVMLALIIGAVADGCGSAEPSAGPPYEARAIRIATSAPGCSCASESR